MVSLSQRVVAIVWTLSGIPNIKVEYESYKKDGNCQSRPQGKHYPLDRFQKHIICLIL